jgi:hypothetical protein
VAELADALDLKSSSERSVGSSPTGATKISMFSNIINEPENELIMWRAGRFFKHLA